MSDLKFKTVGQNRESSDVKDYVISVEGRKYFAQNTGKSKFICPAAGVDRNSSLKDIKMAIAVQIENGEPPIDPIAEAEADGAEAAAAIAGSGNTFDCIHPCALLILEISDRFGQFSAEVLGTLDAYGWLLDGKPDIQRAYRERDR